MLIRLTKEQAKEIIGGRIKINCTGLIGFEFSEHSTNHGRNLRIIFLLQ